ncbi:hypothetical protein GCM10022407_27470 [Hymenobacter antarcticus]|uniref:PKD domain-containing protein n=2 Tax=Hymenobacter antarcticus TaxID=486270 RepID=A0ABP7QDG0_9BACT
MAQGEYSTWYFGQQAGLNFAPGAAPQPLLNGALNTPSACATLSDGAGNLLLYSNGDQVWNRLHQLMPGGNALGGDTYMAQGCVILRSPNTASATAYVFTQRSAGAITPFSTGLPVVAEVQLAAGGTGQVTQTGLPVVADSILQRLGERSFAPYQAVVRHANGREAWLLTRLFEQGVILASLIDGTGRWPCARTVVSRVLPTRNSSSATWCGAIVASPDGRTLLYNDVASSYLLAFDPGTGRVGAPVALAYPAPSIPANINPYTLGGAFSPNGQYLYLDRLYQPSAGNNVGSSAVQVLQYDLAAGSPAAVAQSGVEVYNVSNRNQAKNLPHYPQRGSDGLIYFAVPEATSLDAILAPNARGRACRYTPGYLSLRGRPAARALPTQPNDVNVGPLLVLKAAFGCAGQQLTMRAGAGTGGGAASDSLRWWLGDGRPVIGTRANVDSLNMSYAAPGTYTLRVDRRRQGAVVATATAVVRISPAPRVRLALAPDTVVCAPVSVRLSVGPQPAGSVFSWQDGSTAPTLVAIRPGGYWVDVRNPAGCVARATVQVREQPCAAPTIPNIITPNGDAQNQAFVLRGLNAPDWTLRLYNRWGREIYSREKYNNAWAAQGQPDGVYYYLLRNAATGQKLKGWVEVVR